MDSTPPLSCSRDRITLAAATAHEVNRIYCRGLGDHSQVSWEEAPDWQRESAEAGVRAIIANPATTPEQSHEGWLRLKLADGWTCGPVKDPEKKTHPCCVPYDKLPPEQRTKDTLFLAVVRGILGI